jgi:protein-S-isoprenylcysteine O-methyltransferase
VHDTLLAALMIVFFASEVTLAMARRSRRADGATRADRGSGPLLWIVITGAMTIGFWLSGNRPGRLPFPPNWVPIGAATLIVGGLLFRWWAVITLGRYFTVDVATRSDHTLVNTGPFRLVRHPSYTGLLLAFCGVGVYFGNTYSLLAVMVPITLALVYRMRVEEAALRKALGAPYEAYCARTKRLIPGVI